MVLFPPQLEKIKKTILYVSPKGNKMALLEFELAYYDVWSSVLATTPNLWRDKKWICFAYNLTNIHLYVSFMIFIYSFLLLFIVPNTIPHVAEEDITLGGYDVPKGTIIQFMIDAAHKDPRYWTNPNDFDPSRWLDEEGKLKQNEAFLPFSLGKFYLIY